MGQAVRVSSCKHTERRCDLGLALSAVRVYARKIANRSSQTAFTAFARVVADLV